MSSTRVGKPTITVFRLAALFTLLAVAMGSVVCATESGFECGNWPGCTDSALLPSGQVAGFFYRNPWIEMVHRVSAILAGPLALAAGILVARLRGVHPLARLLPWVTVAGAIVAGTFGRLAVLGLPIPAWGGAVDLASALIAMGAMVVATIALERTPAAWFPTPAGSLAWLGLGLVVAMHLVSLFAAGPGSYTRCLSWPVWDLIAADHAASGTLQIVRLGLAVVAAAVIIATVVRALGQPALRGPAITCAGLLGLVILLGLIIRMTGSDDLGVVFSLATVGLLWTLTLLGAQASLESVPGGNGPRLEASTAAEPSAGTAS